MSYFTRKKERKPKSKKNTFENVDQTKFNDENYEIKFQRKFLRCFFIFLFFYQCVQYRS